MKSTRGAAHDKPFQLLRVPVVAGPVLEDVLTERDLVHRQIVSTIVKHIALGVAGLGCEDSMLHLMNFVWPNNNCFETSPHVIGAVMDAIDAMRVTLGPGILLSYVLQGLFHPARKDTFFISGLLARLQLSVPWRGGFPRTTNTILGPFQFCCSRDGS